MFALSERPCNYGVALSPPVFTPPSSQLTALASNDGEFAPFGGSRSRTVHGPESCR